MGFRHWLLALLASCYCINIAAQPNPQQALETVLAEEQLTGIAWVLLQSPDETSVGAAGWRDNPGKMPFTVDTRFHVGSVTKAVLATGVLRLVTEGRIELDAPALRYLPTLFEAEAPAGFEEITVRHLLDHTSSLNDAQLWQMFSERADADAPLMAAFPRAMSQLQLRARPGDHFSYSNIGYTLLGLIIETVTGQRYEDYLDESLLSPLAMHDSTFGFTTQAGGERDGSLAWGHIDDGSHYAATPIFLRPAGQFTSTAADLGRFLRFLMSDGRIHGDPFIHEELMRSRGKPTDTLAARAGLEAGYGLGLARRDRHGVVGYCHGGNIVGFAAMLCIFPEEGKAFAYSVNTDSETADYGRLDRVLIEALEVSQARVPDSAAPPADTAPWHGQYSLSPNRFQTFEYLDRVFGSVGIRPQGDALTLTSLQRDTRELRSTGSLRYSANDRSTASHVLVKGSDGELFVSDGFQTYRKASGVYLTLHWASLLLGLVGALWILLAGSSSLILSRGQFVRLDIAPAYFGLIMLLIPVPLFFTQSFMALGDITPASLALAGTTLLLPFTLLLTIYRVVASAKPGNMQRLHAVAAICLTQWCVVLAANGMLPARLWAF